MASHLFSSRSQKFAVLIWCFFGIQHCGLSRPDYVKYAPTATTAMSTSTECTAAAQAFSDNINPAISSSCISCHATQAIREIKLVAGDIATNRQAIKAFTGTDPSTLFNKISQNGQAHSGGDRSADLPLAKITAWTDIEATCK